MSAQRFLFPCLPVLLLLLACKKPVKDKNLPEPVEKLLVAAFISPSDTELRVKVGKTFNVTALADSIEENDLVKNAVVQISGNNSSVQLEYQELSEYYSVSASQLSVKPGETYLLTISTPDGHYVKSKTTVPDNRISNLNIEADTISTRDHSGQLEEKYFLKMNWQKEKSETSYYMLWGGFKHPQRSRPHRSWWIDFEGFPGLYRYRTLEKSEGDTAGPVNGTCGLVEMEELFVELDILSIDKNYYNYKRSLEQRNYYADPFAEPENLYTNIEGGIGVFASYRQYTLEKGLE